MFIVSRVIVSRFLGVIFTVRSAVFIVGETEAIVPLTTVPASISGNCRHDGENESPSPSEAAASEARL